MLEAAEVKVTMQPMAHEMLPAFRGLLHGDLSGMGGHNSGAGR